MKKRIECSKALQVKQFAAEARKAAVHELEEKNNKKTSGTSVFDRSRKEKLPLWNKLNTDGWEIDFNLSLDFL